MHSRHRVVNHVNVNPSCALGEILKWKDLQGFRMIQGLSCVIGPFGRQGPAATVEDPVQRELQLCS